MKLSFFFVKQKSWNLTNDWWNIIKWEFKVKENIDDEMIG